MTRAGRRGEDEARIFRLLALNKATHLFASMLDPGRLVALGLDALREIGQARDGAIYLAVTPDGAGPLELTASRTLEATHFPPSLSREAAGLDARLEQGRQTAAPIPGLSEPTAVLPLAARQKLLGCCLLHGRLNPGPWAPEDFEALETVAANLAVCLDNARMVTALRGRVEELDRAREELARAEGRYRSLVEGIPAVMYVATLDGAFSFISARIEDLTGYSPAQWMSSPGFWERSIHPDDRGRVVAEFARARAAGTLLGLDYRLVRADGCAIWIRHRSVSAADPAGGAVRRGFITDIAEQKEAEEALVRQREMGYQREKLASMGELLAGVAHELNNPLTVVLGQTAMVRRDAEGNAPVLDRVERIARAADRCARIVRNFLALARQRPPERTRVDLNRVASEAAELLGYSLRVDSVKLELDLAPALLPLVGDPHQLHQVVVNLITNAHHALRQVEGQRRIRVSTRSDATRGSVCIEVADSGPGIPREIQQRIFEPFFTTKPAGHGTGLGLSLCRGIVESHEGSIRLESEPGRGATFTIELPAAPPGAPGAEAPTAAPSAARASTILVVDDEPEIREVLRDLLRAAGHEVDMAGDGLEGLERLGHREYDLIITDIRMPRLDGRRFFEQTTHRRPELRQRFMVISGDMLTDDSRDFIEHSGLPCLHKPFDLDEVLRAVGKALGPSPG
ncbi:MAG: ATP-binding protein [Candidatus Rokubacteria bacterium]|nr:ATP-binding protein [Candidatus Rokubacteria bacterium]